jgi:hypothetical protein
MSAGYGSSFNEPRSVRPIMHDSGKESALAGVTEGLGDQMSDAPRKPLPPAAQRALAEAAERRRLAEAEQKAHPLPKEFNGPSGPEPTRYGDWERKGIASDF